MWGTDHINLVKKLLHWSMRISAFSLLAHTSEPFFLMGATPMLSGFEVVVWSPRGTVLLMYSLSALPILLIHFWG